MWRVFLALLVAGAVGGCGYLRPKAPIALEPAVRAEHAEYRIGPGDQLQVFVWRNPELTVTVPVRSDGKISVPLLQDVQAAGQTPEALADTIAKDLSSYVRGPQVTVIVQNSAGQSDENIRVVGPGTQPKVIPYRVGMTLVDAMSEAGGLTEFGEGNRAYLVRSVDGKRKKYHLRIGDLLSSGDMSANIELMPGDVIGVPERWY